MDQNSTAEVMEVVDPPQDKSSSASTPLQLEIVAGCGVVDVEKNLATYINWPNQMKLHPIFLVYNGFIYTGCGDCVQCLSCGKALCHWGDRDDPLQVHESLSPDCPYIVTNKQTLASMLPRQQRFRQEASARACTPFDPAASDQPANDRIPLPEQVWSLQRRAFISTI